MNLNINNKLYIKTYAFPCMCVCVTRAMRERNPVN